MRTIQFSTRRARIRAERSTRRRARIAVAISVLGTLVLGVAAIPANAAPALPGAPFGSALPSVHVVGGNRTVTVAWKRLPDTRRYIIRYATKRSMAGAKHVITTRLWTTVPKLRNAHKYWIAVTAERLSPGAITAVTSAVKTATPHGGQPTPVTRVTVTSAGLNRIRVRWSGGGNATQVGVVAGADPSIQTARFTSAWYPATTRSVTLTVPPQFQAVLGAGSANPVYAKVVQTNLRAVNPAMHAFASQPDHYLTSYPYTWSLAGAGSTSEVGVAQLTVAELNVQSISSSAHFTPADQWAARIPRIVNTIEASGASLVATAELSTSRIDSACRVHLVGGVLQYCAEQYNTLADALPGYQLANPDANAVVFAEQQANRGIAWNTAGVTAGAHLLYKPDVLTREDGGFISPRLDLRVTTWPDSLGDRLLSWAKFRINASGQEFIGVAAHFPFGLDATTAAARAEEATAVAAYLDTRAALPDGQHLPILFMGDLNQDTARSTNAPGTILHSAGYFDAASTPNRSGANVSTANGANQIDGADPGYPVHPFTWRYPANRIDYILLKNSPHTYRYANVLHLTNGVFDPAFQGTDHNLQLATIGIGQPQ